MNIKVFPSVLSGTVTVPPSKSFAHRLLILASLKESTTFIENVGESDDVKATINSLIALGAKITLKNGNAEVVGKPSLVCTTVNNDYIDLPVNESGSTYRFLIVLSSVLGKKVRYQTRGKLASRPNDALLALLCEHGIEFDDESKTQSGILLGDRFEIDASVSSQYITAFMLALPFLKRKTTLVLKGNIVSKDYIAITEECLKIANIRFEKTRNSYTFFGSDEYKLPDRVRIEGDYSASSFFLASSFLTNGKVGVKGLNLNSPQGDRAILDIFKNIGADVLIKNDTIFISKQISVNPIEISAENIIDSIPILAVVSSFIRGTSKFSDVDRLAIKESNRLEAILEMLKSAHCRSRYSHSILSITGRVPECSTFNGYSDHRIVMAEAILASFAVGEYSIISNKEAVNKSYPNFWNDFVQLGGKISDV